MKTSNIATLVIGATGYVGGEFLRLIHSHPNLVLHAAVSENAAGQPVANTFAHLARAFPSEQFQTLQSAVDAMAGLDRLAVFSAAPHGGAAAAIQTVLQAAEQHAVDVHVVDASADFRLSNLDDYKTIYGQAHGAPNLVDEFSSALPEHLANNARRHIGHPGCFATAMQLAIVPLLKSGAVDAPFFATGITGSTGSGKQPTATTHSPERHSNLFAYKPLAHRHAPEVIEHASNATGVRPALHFVPHSGPFARGIHMTVQTPNTTGIDADQVQALFADYYQDQPFVRVVDGMPRLKNVVASNYADIGVAGDADSLCVCVVIDNLLKGAAGGCMQWMNRLLGFEQTRGLDAAPPAWT